MRKENEEFVIRRSLKISQKKLESLGWEYKGTIPSGTKIFKKKKGEDFCFGNQKLEVLVASLSLHMYEIGGKIKMSINSGST